MIITKHIQQLDYKEWRSVRKCTSYTMACIHTSGGYITVYTGMQFLRFSWSTGHMQKFSALKFHLKIFGL